MPLERLDRELLIDSVVVIAMFGYGFVIIEDDPAMAAAAWLVALLLLFKHTIQPISEFAEENEMIYLSILFSILVSGLILSI